VEMAQFEAVIRDELNKRAQRRMAVLHPLKLVIDNYPDGQTEEMDAVNNPEDASAGTRKVPFSKILYIEQNDFRETPPPKYFRLYPGNEVRLRYAYLIKCTHVVKNDAGEVIEVHCTYDPASHGGEAPDGRRVKSTIHWVSAEHAVQAEVRMYDPLFTVERPDDGELETILNPNSVEALENTWVESALADAKVGDTIQFERTGYFCIDPDSRSGKLVFNLTVNLRDTWSKIQKKSK
jgi:glutaminyl-tRNA synthetase